MQGNGKGGGGRGLVNPTAEGNMARGYDGSGTDPPTSGDLGSRLLHAPPHPLGLCVRLVTENGSTHRQATICCPTCHPFRHSQKEVHRAGRYRVEQASEARAFRGLISQPKTPSPTCLQNLRSRKKKTRDLLINPGRCALQFARSPARENTAPPKRPEIHKQTKKPCRLLS